MKVILTSILFVTCVSVTAQHFSFKLSPHHLKKIDSYQSGHKRLVKYYKLAKRDSLRQLKHSRKYYTHLLDSTFRLKTKGRKNMPANVKEEDLRSKLDSCLMVIRDSTSSDSLKGVATEQARRFAVNLARREPEFQEVIDQWSTKPDTISWQSIGERIKGFDTLSSLFNSSPEEVLETIEGHGNNVSSGITSPSNDLNGLIQKYHDQFRNFGDVGQLKEKAILTAIDESADPAYTGIEQSAQHKVSSLLKKYKSFVNSSDLTNAKRQTSLSDATLCERLTFSGDFNITSTDPFSIDIAPQVGYKFNTKFVAGLGARYRCTTADTTRNNASFKSIVSYDIAGSFFVTTELEWTRIKIVSNDQSITKWMNNLSIGAGKRILLYPKLYLIVKAMYSLNPDKDNPIRSNRFKIRFGFQLSELVTRKKKIEFDPNR